MPDDRIRSIVPMFGGATAYVDTLERILAYVAASEPDHDDLIEWHREQFANVQSQQSIERRLRYLADVGFVEQTGGTWTLSWAGHRYFADKSREVLFDIMAERNVGLQSVLFELAAEPMTIEEVNAFLLDTHDELDWDPSNTDMAQQRLNWLRSMDLVERLGEDYQLTGIGESFVAEVESIRSVWVPDETFRAATDGTTEFTAGEYQTTQSGRVIDPEFRAVVLQRYDETCPVSAIDHPRLLDVAHVLPWSEYPEHRADFRNVLALSKTHHAAFDAGLFTLDRDYRVRVHPEFETDSEHLQRTLLQQEGESVEIPPSAEVSQQYLRKHNQQLEWYSAAG